MNDESVDKLSGSENGQQQDAGAVTHNIADPNDIFKAKLSKPKKRVAKESIKPIKQKQSRKRLQGSADELQMAEENEAAMNDIFNPSFNCILRNMPMSDRDDDHDFLEAVRTYLRERGARARSAMELGNRLSDLKRYVRFRAKLAVIDVVLSVETQEAVRRVLGQ